MASRPRSILRDTGLDPLLDYELIAVDFSLPSEFLLTPPPSSPEPFDSPHLTSQKPPSSNDITQTEHAECEWCLGPDICIRTGESEKGAEDKVFFWPTLPGGRAISLATVNRVLNRVHNGEDSSCHSSCHSERGNKARVNAMERLEGAEFKRMHRIARARKEDQESEERRRYIWRIQEDFGTWEEEKRLQMEDEMRLMERRERKRQSMEAPLREEEMEVKEMKRRWKKGGAKW